MGDIEEGATPQGTTQPAAVPSFLQKGMFSHVPRTTKTLAIILGVLYLITTLIPQLRLYLLLVPAYTIPPHFYVWNLFTSTYIETSIVNTILSILVLLLVGRYLEPIWGSREFVKFVLLVNFTSAVTTFFLMVLQYLVTEDITWWFQSQAGGFGAALGGFAVALKQLLPEHEILFFVFSIRTKHLPVVIVLANIALSVLGFPSESTRMCFLGVIVAWIYLRFFQVKSGNVVGDRNESFSFASFFPEPMQPFVSLFSRIVFNLVNLCSCGQLSRHEALARQQAATAAAAAQASESSIDTERRKARALRALDQRMQLQSTASQSDIQSPMLSSSSVLSPGSSSAVAASVGMPTDSTQRQ